MRLGGVVALLLFGALLGACADFAGTAVEPGVGVKSDEGTINLGDDFATIRDRFGEPDRRWDFGAEGIRVWYIKPRVLVWLDGPGDSAKATSLEIGGSAGVSGGVSIGNRDFKVRAYFGAPVVDPFVGTWLYPYQGIGFRMEGDGVTYGPQVSSIFVFPAKP